MQTQNYVYYMHFLVLKKSEQRCARALFVNDSDRRVAGHRVIMGSTYHRKMIHS